MSNYPPVFLETDGTAQSKHEPGWWRVDGWSEYSVVESSFIFYSVIRTYFVGSLILFYSL